MAVFKNPPRRGCKGLSPFLGDMNPEKAPKEVEALPVWSEWPPLPVELPHSELCLHQVDRPMVQSSGSGHCAGLSRFRADEAFGSSPPEAHDL